MGKKSLKGMNENGLTDILKEKGESQIAYIFGPHCKQSRRLLLSVFCYIFGLSLYDYVMSSISCSVKHNIFNDT